MAEKTIINAQNYENLTGQEIWDNYNESKKKYLEIKDYINFTISSLLYWSFIFLKYFLFWPIFLFNRIWRYSLYSRPLSDAIHYEKHNRDWYIDTSEVTFLCMHKLSRPHIIFGIISSILIYNNVCFTEIYQIPVAAAILDKLQFLCTWYTNILNIVSRLGHYLLNVDITNLTNPVIQIPIKLLFYIIYCGFTLFWLMATPVLYGISKSAFSAIIFTIFLLIDYIRKDGFGKFFGLIRKLFNEIILYELDMYILKTLPKEKGSLKRLKRRKTYIIKKPEKLQNKTSSFVSKPNNKCITPK